MNIIKEIRDYVKSKAREISPRINESQNPHNDNTVGQMKLDESYFLRFLSTPVTQGQNVHTYSINTEIEFISKAGSRPNDAHDKVMCNSIDLGASLVSSLDYADKFNSVTITNITPEPLENNERFTKVTLAVTFIAVIKDGI